MKKRALLLVFLLSATASFSQSPSFHIKYSEPLSVFIFIRKLTSDYGNNTFKKLFAASRFAIPKYTNLIAELDSLPLDYTYQFPEFPYGTKIPGMTEALLQKNLIASSSINDFTLRSVGLIPNSSLLKLTGILTAFTPVYNELVYAPNKEQFEKQLQRISTYAATKNVAGFVDIGLTFYHSAWDNSIPFEIAFYPWPDAKGFTATAIYNNAVSAIQTDYDDYDGLLSVMLHEIFHILYDEQSLATKQELYSYFRQNTSTCSNYAFLLLNEALATVMGNGYVYEQLIGEPDSSAWYNKKYIDQMAKKIYPMTKDYIAMKKPIDQAFIDNYIHLYEQHHKAWLTELSNTMTYRYMLSTNMQDHADMNQLYHASMSEDDNEITVASIARMKATPLSKVIVVSKDHAAQLALIKKQFTELRQWKYNAGKEFAYQVFLSDKSQLYIINKYTSSLEDLIKTL